MDGETLDISQRSMYSTVIIHTYKLWVIIISFQNASLGTWMRVVNNGPSWNIKLIEGKWIYGSGHTSVLGSVCVYVCGGGWDLRHGSNVSGSLSHCLKLHNTTSCWTSLCSVNIVALQEAVPTQHVLLHEVNNNTERSADGCWQQSGVM